MSDQPPNPASPSGSPGLIERLVVDQLGTFVNRFPARWKTLTGLLLLVAAWIVKGFIATGYPQYPWIPTVAEWVEYGALALCGIGVYHKALLADPSRVSGGPTGG